jgi:1,2-phenylacetyl-CoA epoxidase PaaB subunit
LKEPVYEVFARKSREEPLRHIGWVNATDGDLARVYAWKTYDEQNWAEMCVIPRSAILPVDPGESQFVTAARDGREDEIVHSRGTGSYGGADVAVKEAAR